MWFKKAQTTENPLNGKSNASARNYVNKLIRPYTKGLFSDEGWKQVNKIWNVLDENGINWAMTNSQYAQDEKGNLIRKEWKFEIYFSNKNNKPTTLYGTIVAAGAGSVNDPLEKYDLVAIVF
ncbi:MAG: hypothetical protein ACOCUV_03870 [bacterium]